MISGGNATVLVANLDDAIQFYTERLGLQLTNRFGHQWATVWAGPCYWTGSAVAAGLTIGLQPASTDGPLPGTPGSVGFGLETYMPLESVVALFAERGVRTEGDMIRYEAGNVIRMRDRDGTPSYVNEFPPEMVASEGRPAGDTSRLISGGHAIVYVSDMDAGIRFYTSVLGMTLTNRFDNHFATAEAGTLLLGIHPRTTFAPSPGTRGSVVLGLTIDEPIERVVSRLTTRGVRTNGPIVRAEQGDSIEIADPDGNTIVLREMAGDQATRSAPRPPAHAGVA